MQCDIKKRMIRKQERVERKDTSVGSVYYRSG